jgi:hypothetical protein
MRTTDNQPQAFGLYRVAVPIGNLGGIAWHEFGLARLFAGRSN